MSDADSPLARVFLVVVDETEEMGVALHYACRRARRTGGHVALLSVLEPGGGEGWLSVEALMRAERRDAAEMRLLGMARAVIEVAGAMPIFHLREGSPRDELMKLLDEDRSISVVVLAAGTGSDGPGPLISHLLGKGLARLKVPLTVVPGTLTREQLDAIT